MNYFIKSALILIVSTTPFVCNGQKKVIDAKLNVRSVTVFEENFEDNKQGTKTKEAFTKFDAQNNILEEIEYDKDEKIKSHITYEYDASGNKIRETYLKANGTTDKVFAYTYLNGLKTEKIVYYSNGKVKSKKSYVYQFAN